MKWILPGLLMACAKAAPPDPVPASAAEPAQALPAWVEAHRPRPDPPFGRPAHPVVDGTVDVDLLAAIAAIREAGGTWLVTDDPPLVPLAGHLVLHPIEGSHLLVTLDEGRVTQIVGGGNPLRHTLWTPNQGALAVSVSGQPGEGEGVRFQDTPAQPRVQRLFSLVRGLLAGRIRPTVSRVAVEPGRTSSIEIEGHRVGGLAGCLGFDALRWADDGAEGLAVLCTRYPLDLHRFVEDGVHYAPSLRFETADGLVFAGGGLAILPVADDEVEARRDALIPHFGAR